MFLKKNIHQKIGEQFDWKSTYPQKDTGIYPWTSQKQSPPNIGDS